MKILAAFVFMWVIHNSTGMTLDPGCWYMIKDERVSEEVIKKEFLKHRSLEEWEKWKCPAIEEPEV